MVHPFIFGFYLVFPLLHRFLRANVSWPRLFAFLDICAGLEFAYRIVAVFGLDGIPVAFGHGFLPGIPSFVEPLDRLPDTIDFQKRAPSCLFPSRLGELAMGMVAAFTFLRSPARFNAILLRRSTAWIGVLIWLLGNGLVYIGLWGWLFADFILAVGLVLWLFPLSSWLASRRDTFSLMLVSVLGFLALYSYQILLVNLLVGSFMPGLILFFDLHTLVDRTVADPECGHHPCRGRAYGPPGSLASVLLCSAQHMRIGSFSWRPLRPWFIALLSLVVLGIAFGVAVPILQGGLAYQAYRARLENPPPVSSLRTFYISSRGNDANPGTSAEQAWRSLARANRVRFAPDDRLLPEGGARSPVFLQFDQHDVGTLLNPITIGSTGDAPAVIDAGDHDAVTLANTMAFRVTNLHLVGSGLGRDRGSGVLVSNDLPGNLKLPSIRLDHLETEGFGQYGVLVDGNRGRVRQSC